MVIWRDIVTTELLGDKVERILHKVGADKVARIIERNTGRPCGCKKRKEFLNKLQKQMQEMRTKIAIDQMKNNRRR